MVMSSCWHRARTAIGRLRPVPSTNRMPGSRLWCRSVLAAARRLRGPGGVGAGSIHPLFRQSGLLRKAADPLPEPDLARWLEFGTRRPVPARPRVASRRRAGAPSPRVGGASAGSPHGVLPHRRPPGTSYARKGQVPGAERGGAGFADAPLRGLDHDKPIATSKWRKIAKQASENLLVAAKLMPGRWPEIEEVFADSRTLVFQRDLATRCLAPIKHVHGLRPRRSSA